MILATSATLLLTIASSNYTEVKLAEACLNYSSCDRISVVIPQRGNDYKLLVAGTDATGVAAALSACQLGGQLQGRVKLESGEAMMIPLTAPIAALAPAPVSLRPDYLAKNGQKLKEIIQQGLKDPAAAGNALLALWGLKDSGYVVKVDPKIDRNLAITDHGIKEVHVSSKFDNSCELFWFLRHEIEHIAQLQFAQSCAAKNQGTYFMSHEIRELGAYLGDTAYSNIFCNANEQANIRLNSEAALVDYLNKL